MNKSNLKKEHSPTSITLAQKIKELIKGDFSLETEKSHILKHYTISFFPNFAYENQFQHKNKSLTERGQTLSAPRMEILLSQIFHTEAQ